MNRPITSSAKLPLKCYLVICTLSSAVRQSPSSQMKFNLTLSADAKMTISSSYRLVIYRNANNGAKVLFATDDWFAPAENLLNSHDPVFKIGLFTDYGKWMDGWETRRKRIPGHDWCIIKLGAPGVIRGIDVDTAFFTGNYAPRFSLQAARLSTREEESIPERPQNVIGTACSTEISEKMKELNSKEWTELVPMIPLRPGYEDTRHNYFNIDSKEHWTHLRLNMYPDGGIARLRVYGEVFYEIDLNATNELDLVALQNGGTCQNYSNAHYGHPQNLIRPGRGKDMGDGWETARRLDRPPVLEINAQNILQVPGHEWAILRLGCVGIISHIEIDTAHFKGNFPDSAKIEGALVQNLEDEVSWQLALPTSKLAAHRIHEYSRRDLIHGGPFTHVRITIAPDGGLSRLRVFGVPVRNLSNINLY